MKPSRPTCVAVLTAALTLVHGAVAGAYTPPSSARAENTPLHLGSSSTPHAGASASSGGSITRTLVGLVVVVALIYTVTWILRKLKRPEGRAVGTGLESVANLPLGPGRSLALVRAGSELVLVGVAEHQVTALRRYSEDEARAAGLLGEDADVAQRVDTLTPEGARRLSRSLGADTPGMERPWQSVLDTLRNWTVRS